MVSFILAFALQSFFPLFGSNPGEFTGLSAVNPDDQSRDYVVRVTPEDGGTPRTGRITLPANGQRGLVLGEIVGGPVASAGWVQIETDASAPRVFIMSGNSELLD